MGNFITNFIRSVKDPNVDAVPFIGNPFNNKQPKTTTTQGAQEGATFYDAAQGKSYTYKNGKWSEVASEEEPKDQPYNPTTPFNSSTAGGGGSSRETDPATAAFYGDRLEQLRGILGGIGQQRDQGVTSIEDDYRRNLSRNNEDQSRILSDIATKREDSRQGKLREVNNVDNNVRNTVESFKRLVGMNHAGNSMFAREFVPMAAARTGSAERSKVFDTYGRNERDLKTSEDGAVMQGRRNVEDLGIQRNQRLSDFLGSINDTENQLRDQAAEAAYNQQQALGGNADAVRSAIAPFATSMQDRIARMQDIFTRYRNPTMSISPIDVKVPELQQYASDPLVAQLMAENPDMSIQDLPYLPMLRKRQPQAAL